MISSQNGSRKREKKIILHNRPRIENFKKMAKKFKKLQKTIQTSFQAKTGRDSSRKREKKNYHSDHSYPIQIRKFEKKGQKNSKN